MSKNPFGASYMIAPQTPGLDPPLVDNKEKFVVFLTTI